MRILVPVVFCFILAGCSTGSNSVTEQADVTDSAEIQPASDFTLASLAGEWHMVTQMDNDWVLFYPCDADNTFVQIKGDSIIIGWGQDATLGKIESWSTSNDYLSLVVNDSYSTNTYRVQQTEDGLTQWWLWKMQKVLLILFLRPKKTTTQQSNNHAKSVGKIVRKGNSIRFRKNPEPMR